MENFTATRRWWRWEHKEQGPHPREKPRHQDDSRPPDLFSAVLPVPLRPLNSVPLNLLWVIAHVNW